MSVPRLPPHRRLVTASSRRRADARAAPLAARYFDGLRIGDGAAAGRIVEEALAAGLPGAAVQSRVIAPAMWRIGTLWEQNAIGPAEEHLATAISLAALTRIYPGLMTRSATTGERMVAVAAAHGEQHVMGLRMAADVLEGAGFDVRFLGGDLPPLALASWVCEHRPALVALGATLPLNGSALVRQVRNLHEIDSALRFLLGGQGVPSVLRDVPGIAVVETTETVVDAVERALSAPAVELPAEVGRGGVVWSRQSIPFSGRLDTVEGRFAATTAAAADTAREQSRRAFALEQLAFRDPLTGLWNRRAFDDRHRELLDDPDQSPPAVVLLDVDHFKRLNDQHGHARGDAALATVARCITSALRPGDMAARYGGDEFAILLPGADAATAMRVAGRLRTDVSHGLSGLQLTVSLGVSVPEHRDRRRAALDADRALYEAKEHGRDQVELGAGAV